MLVMVMGNELLLLPAADCSVRAAGSWSLLSPLLASKPTALGAAESQSALGGFGMSLAVHPNLPRRLEEEVWVNLAAC